MKLYVEGGGDRRESKRACRKGFTSFMGKAGLQGNMPSIVACGSRKNAYDRFRIAHATGESAMLLVDAEGQVTAQGPWQHLKTRDNWDRPTAATDEQCHMMVQTMESWFLADVDVLESYYGANFRRQALPQNRNIEDIPKRDVDNGLDRATRNTQKGRYSKGRHSFEILERLDPEKVAASSPYAKRLIDALIGTVS